MTPVAKTRLSLVGIVLIFTLPVFTAWVIRDDPALLGMSETKNYGQLLEPAVPVSLAEYVSSDLSIGLRDMPGRWVMLHLDTDGRCDLPCETSLQDMQQVHILLNKDVQRLQRKLIVLGRLDADRQTQLREHDPALQILNWDESQMLRLSERLKLPFEDGMILMMDPLGNIMMRYPRDFDPYGVQSDLRLLFKASQVG